MPPLSQPRPSWPSHYILPSSPTILVEDRFSILDTDDLEVPFWYILQTLLSQPITDPTQSINLLETISILRHGNSRSSDYLTLKAFLSNLPTDFWTETWPILATIALSLPSLFPSHELPILSPSTPRIVLSRPQIAALVIHQFLCTLSAPFWQDGYQDFALWFHGDQPHPRAVEAYLTALFTYFDRVATRTLGEWDIVFELVTDDEGLLEADQALSRLHVRILDEASTAPDLLGVPRGAAVISANKFIGFGKTGTQEETHVGASPEVCPAVLITPPLLDGQVVVVSGAEAMVSIAGYGRDARLEAVLTAEKTERTWEKRTMLFMDAMELDLADQERGVPVDLQPGHVERDLRKAYIAFKHKKASTLPEEPPMIFTGFWGCGSFGGNPEIKACIQWCAASLAGCDLTFICSGEGQRTFAEKLNRFIADVSDIGVRAGDLRSVILELKPDDVLEGSTPFMVILQRLEHINRGS